jgi:hypothetical protein
VNGDLAWTNRYCQPWLDSESKSRTGSTQDGDLRPPGSGKTFTALLLAEGLAKVTRRSASPTSTPSTAPTSTASRADRGRCTRRRSTSTRSTRARSPRVSSAVAALKPEEYGVVIIDSITHLWEAARAAYDGRQTRVGTIPMQAWGKIKKPYKDLMAFLLSSPMHVIICGRQGVEYETDEETDELKAVGVKMKAEGETPYEPHILIRMEAIRPKKTNEIATDHRLRREGPHRRPLRPQFPTRRSRRCARR